MTNMGVELLSFPVPPKNDPAYKIARIISLATGSPWTHNEVRFSDGRCFSSAAPDGVRWRVYTEEELTYYEVEIIQTPWRETPDLIAWCDSIVGCPYDYLGALKSASGKTRNNSGAWFCSEAAADVLSRCTPYPGRVPFQPHPGALRDWVAAQLGIVVSSCLRFTPDPTELNAILAACADRENLILGEQFA